MNSLERRLHLGLGSALALLLALLWWLGGAALGLVAEEFAASRLEHDAEDLLPALSLDSSGPHLAQGGGEIIYERPFSGHYYLVLDDQGRQLRSRSLWDDTLAVAPLPTGGQRRWYTAGPAGQRLLVWARGYRLAGGPVTVAVAEDLTPVQAGLDRYRGYYALIAAAVLVVLLVLQRAVIRRSFRPLGRVHEQVRALEEGRRERLDESAVPSEVQPLVREVNRLLGVLRERLLRSRNALGNLAHTLKGPLNLLVQLSDHRELEGLPALRDELRSHADRLAALLERELKRARLVGSGPPGSRFAAAEELPAMVRLLERMYDGRALRIGYRIEGSGEAAVDRDDALELLGNLLDNACKWAASRVRLTVTAGPDLTLVVEDDGPGADAADLAQLTARGRRADEGVPGHGLGLAIVRDVVELYGGELRLDRSPELGGLRARVHLPVGGAKM